MQALAGLSAANGDEHPGEAVKAVLNNALITAEPGGQLELSSAPAESLGELVDVTMRDLAALRDAMAAAGLELCGYGLDPLRPPERVLNLPRYDAMERFFDRDGPWGRQMMCGTASVQVCVDAGDEGEGQSGYRSRWQLLHTIGPVLVSAFANSPLRDGRPTGWRSARQQVWAHLDPGRTRAPETDAVRAAEVDPRDAWAKYALDAEVMCVRDPDSSDWTAPEGLTFRHWLRGPTELRQPTTDDLDYHLSTLFPPVRPRGHLELRMIDAQSGDGWVVPAAVVSALAGDVAAGDVARDAAERVWAEPDGDPWLRAARCGPADPGLSQAGKRCFEAAMTALSRAGTPETIVRAVEDFTERYVTRDRCPADDQLEEGNHD
jgi:ergothioneine biosynthesis glutamate--cysteine ligase EgtA